MAPKSERGSLDRRTILLSDTALVAATMTPDALAQAQRGAAPAPAAGPPRP